MKSPVAKLVGRFLRFSSCTFRRRRGFFDFTFGCVGDGERAVDGVNIYRAGERAGRRAEAAAAFKMSFSSSVLRNSAAALKKNK